MGKRIEIVKVNGRALFKLDGRKRLFTKTELRKAEMRYDKAEKKRKKKRKKKKS